MQSAEKLEKSAVINGIDTDALKDLVSQVAADPKRAMTHWQVVSTWKGGTRSDAHVSGYTFGGTHVKKNFTIQADEPLELGGTNRFANPQEILMAAFNACMMVGYAAGCAMEGIELEDLRIETQGDIDLRGFFGLDPNVKPGYSEIQYTVHIKGKGTPEQFRKVHENVCATSPNRFNLANPIRLESKLVVE
ncbi:MAG: OsmC family protein [bacterium]